MRFVTPLLAALFFYVVAQAATTALSLTFCPGTTNAYTAWVNFPQSNTFFPLSVWSENPTRVMTNGQTDAQAMAAVGANILYQVDNGGGDSYPAACNTDSNGLMHAAILSGIYTINLAEPVSNTCPVASPIYNANATVSSNLAAATAAGGAQWFISYNLSDEPGCGTSGAFQIGSTPGYVTGIRGFDSTRPVVENMTDWVFNHGICSPSSLNTNAVAALDISSFDLYPIISPWNNMSSGLVNGKGFQDSMWIQGWSVNRFLASSTKKLVWAFIDTGDDALAYSAQNSSTCNYTTNTCTHTGEAPHEARATPEEVNAEAWMTLINGGLGIEYFCDDSGNGLTPNTTYFDWCLGNGGSTQAVAAAANVKYIDQTVTSFAPQIYGATAGICTMNNGTGYTNYTTSCSNGILTMATGTSTVPGSALAKTYSGVLYLFADSDRTGSAAMTFTLSGYAGKTAKVVYDSNAQYDAAHSSVGNTFTLNGSGQFTDTFGANGHDYQPKIYSVQ